MKLLLVFFSAIGASVGSATRHSIAPQRHQSQEAPQATQALHREQEQDTEYPVTSTFTSKTTFRMPPLNPWFLPGPEMTVFTYDITTLEPHSSQPTSYPETIVQTAITIATNTMYTYRGSSYDESTITITNTRFDTYHVHTPAASHLRPGYSFTDFPGCGDCILDIDWTPDQTCEVNGWGTGCANQQCQWREDEGEAGLWYCFAGPHRGDREYMGRLCWRGDDIGFETLAKPCLYGDQLPHCVPCVGMRVKCGKDNGPCPTRPGHPDFRTEVPGSITSRAPWM
ncbi:hypothetical protein MMYC01_208852 [Madurella mycetomatis]|uniref:Uncharacterized protein n=1 Tax=Madurella mycetomatis TaxID=100816 RepID=A0A175VUW7_9PEZI|nr:hypothetical protein MMYC01_208852 [Madurella mycetomatis]